MHEPNCLVAPAFALSTMSGQVCDRWVMIDCGWTIAASDAVRNSLAV